jgi:hypothetical protein
VAFLFPGRNSPDSVRANSRVGDKEETAMNGKKAFVVLAVTTALSYLSCASAVAKDDMGDMGERGERGGSVVVRCSLRGVNPAVHPEIFGNPAVAASYGFVRSRDGTWHVGKNCVRGPNRN